MRLRWGHPECHPEVLTLSSGPFLEAFSHCKFQEAGTHSPAVGLVVYSSLLHCVVERKLGPL